ncbi:MAG: DUF192 domain-containing protein [Proteobacteria bacterium]|nr:DUF192 domain-containing protein [Pseudomonadota bacterium]
MARVKSALAGALALASLACSARQLAPQPRADAALPLSVAIFRPPGRTVRLRVEVARDPAARARGLMFRQQLAADAGMVFLFEREEQHPFWMKNTLLPLDMIFVDGRGAVVGVVHDTEPMTLTPRDVDRPSRTVVEVRAGFARAHGIGVGTTFELQLPQ